MKILGVSRRLVVRITSIIPAGLRWSLTRGLLESHGIGWGASTTDFEAQSASRILNKLGIKNPVAIDIGANIGNWSKAFTTNSPLAVSYAFEPSLATYKQLLNNIQGYTNIFPSNLGMSEKEGVAKLFTDSVGSGLASLSSRRLDHFNISMEKFEEVSLSTVDIFIKTHNILPSIVKIDVEGHELSVLLGASDSISRIPLFQFEFGGCNLDTHTTFQDFWYFFSERNFAIYRLGPRGIVLVESYSEIYEVYITTNYFAINKNYKPDNFA